MFVEDEGEHDPDLDEVLAELRRRVELRRSTGDYPEGLEDDLARHFRRIQGLQGTLITSEQIDAARGAVRDAVRFDRSRPPAESRVPGTDLAQRAISKAIRADIANLLEQFRTFAAAVSSAIDVLAAAVDDPPRHVHPDLVGSVYAFEQRLASIERRLAAEELPKDALGARVAELERRLAAIDAPSSRRVDAQSPLGGAERADAVVALVADRAPVLHLGSGSGQLLETLRARGIAGEGTTDDAIAARTSTAQGLVVHHVDPLAHLTRLPPDAIRSLVITELPPGREPSLLDDIVQLAARRLPAGGRLVIDAVGIAVEPAHVELLVAQAGFDAVDSLPPSSDGLVVATR